MKTKHVYTVAPEDQADHEIGLELIRVLNLRIKRDNGRVETSHGDKYPCGLARTIRHLVEVVPATPDETLIRESDFARLPNDYNGNPRYYLAVYLTTEPAARAAGGVKYRGKQFGPGWVFQTHALCSVVDSLNRSAR
jgi:hypothetical protein